MIAPRLEYLRFGYAVSTIRAVFEGFELQIYAHKFMLLMYTIGKGIKMILYAKFNDDRTWLL